MNKITLLLAAAMIATLGEISHLRAADPAPAADAEVQGQTQADGNTVKRKVRCYFDGYGSDDYVWMGMKVPGTRYRTPALGIRRFLLDDDYQLTELKSACKRAWTKDTGKLVCISINSGLKVRKNDRQLVVHGDNGEREIPYPDC